MSNDEDFAALAKSRLFMDLVRLVDRLNNCVVDAGIHGELDIDPSIERDIQELHARIGRLIESDE